MKKKSGAAQRLVSLVLALGLIFTLAPASVFAGDEAPASSAVMAAVDEEPVADGTAPVADGSAPVADDSLPVADDSLPVADGTEPAVDDSAPIVDGSAPVADGTEPAVDDSAPIVDGSAPAVDGSAPVADGTEPVADSTEPAVEEELSSQQTALLAASVPAVMSSRGMPHYYEVSIKADPEIKVYAAVKYQNDIFDDPDWYNNGNETDYVEGPLDTSSDKIYLLFSVPEGKTPKVDFYTGIEKAVSEFPGNIDLPADMIAEAQAKGITHYCVFTHDDQALLPGQILIWERKFDVNVNFAETDAYFYLHRYDAQAGDLAKTDYYYIGMGKVELGAPSLGVEYSNAQSLILQAPNESIILDATNRELTTYEFDFNDTDAEGTYSIRSWDVIKGESGATTAYPDNEPLVENELTWHVDGTVELNMPAAYFYGLKPGADEDSEDSNDYCYIGVGEVALKSAEAGKSVALTDDNRSRVVAQEPSTFPSIEHNGVTYTYATPNKDGTCPAGTYSIEDWYEVVAETGAVDGNENTIPGTENKTTWHVNGKIVLHGPVDVPDTINQPKEGALQDVDVVYDGKTHVLETGKYVHFSEAYQIKDKDGMWVDLKDWNPNMTIPYLIDCGYMEVKVIYTYNKPAGDQNVYNTIEDEAFIRVNQRPITLKANDDKISDGDPIPKFTFTITSGSLAEGDNIIDVTYGGYANKLGIYNLVITGYKIVDAKDNNADVTGNYEVTLLPGVFTIGTAGGGGGTTPTPNPNPNPTPVPVPVEPETPVTPVAPVTPDEEEEEPAEVEDIEEEETPQASPDTDADKEEDKTENIEDEETAQAGAPGEGNWALLNLILMALTVVAGLAMLALRFARKTGMAHLLGIVPAIVALVAFFVTEDMSLPMAMTDKWTLIMALIAVVQVVLLVLGRNGAQEDDQPREQY